MVANPTYPYQKLNMQASKDTETSSDSETEQDLTESLSEKQYLQEL